MLEQNCRQQIELLSLKKVFAFWPSGELVGYTQANLIAGIAGQLTSIPSVQRITHSDLLLPVEAFSTIYPLVLTLSALYCNASVALNSVAGRSPDLVLATQGVAPTIIVAAPATLNKTHSDTTEKANSTLYGVIHWLQRRTLVENGVMPIATMFSKAFDSIRPIIGTSPGKLRLIFVANQIGGDSTPLSAETLSDLRIYTGSRIIYALTSSRVAGAVTQTGVYDYRVGTGTEEHSHFGAPVTSLEVFFQDTEQYKTTDKSSAGEIWVQGPAVVGGKMSLGVSGRINEDHTLALL